MAQARHSAFGAGSPGAGALPGRPAPGGDTGSGAIRPFEASGGSGDTAGGFFSSHPGLRWLAVSLGLAWAPVAGAHTGGDGLAFQGNSLTTGGHVMSFLVKGDYAYCSVAGSEGLETWDVSNPSNPTRISMNGRSNWRAWSKDDTLFSFGHFRGVEMFDISGGIPLEIDTYDPRDRAVAYEGGAQLGDKLYVAAHQIGIDILKVTNSLTHESTFALSQNDAWDVEVSGNHIFVANGSHGLSVVDVSGSPSEVATLELPGSAGDIVISGSVAALALGGAGVVTVDISNPSAPKMLDIEPSWGNASRMGLVGSYLAVGSYGCVELFDLADPEQIRRVGWDQTANIAMGAGAGVNSAGDTLIVVADWKGMVVYSPGEEAGPDIDVEPLRIDFGAVSANRDTVVEVHNRGGRSLNVSAVTAPSGIEASPSSFTVPAGGMQEVTVTASGSQTTRGQIRYFSDDGDESAFDQRVYKNNSSFPQVGSTAPDFTLAGTDGQNHTLSDYRGRVVYLEFGANW